MMNSSVHLNVAILPMMGIFVIDNSSEIIITGGYEKALFQMLSEYLKFTYTLKIPANLEWGYQTSNGTWTGLVGMIQRGEADLAISRFGVFEARMSVIDYSYPYYIEEVNFVKKLPEPLSTTMAFFYPFSKNVWWCIMLSLSIMTVVFHFFLTTKYSLLELAMKVFGCILNQPSGMKFYYFKDKVIILFFYLGIFLITSTYITTLLSFLTLPIVKDNIQNIEELSGAVEKGKVECTTLKGTFNTFTKSSSKFIQIIGKSLKEENMVEPEKENVGDFVKKKNGILIAAEDDIKVLLDDVFISEDSFNSIFSAIAISKKFQQKKKLDSFIHKLWASGIYMKNVNDYFLVKKFPSKNKGGAKQLKLSNMLGIFWLLGFGLSISFIVFLGEILTCKLKTKSKNLLLNENNILNEKFFLVMK